MDLSDFHFLRPAWFAAAIPLAAALWLIARSRRGEKSWETVCDRHLLPHILIGRDVTSGKKFLYLAALTGALSIIALAGPTAERLPQPAFRDQSALVIALDLSHSMNAVDVSPNRLVRARYKINDLISRRQTGQTALVAYAADAFTVVPLTDDVQAIKLYLSTISTDVMPAQGSRPDRALEQSAALIKQAAIEKGDILLVTDHGDDRSPAIARAMAQKGHRVSVLGIGTKNGAPIRMPSGNLLSHKGKTVVPRFEAAKLRKLADAGGGVYRRFDPTGESDIAALTALFASAPKTAEEEDRARLFSKAWKEQGPWLVLLLLPLAAFGFKRGLLVLALCAVLPFPRPAAAAWDQLWWRDDQRGMRAFEKGDTETAAELFKDPRWRAASAYRSGNFQQARKELGEPQNANDWYNLGNILAHEGNFEKAIKSYRRAMKLEPDMEDAEFNMKLVEQLLQQQQQQQQAQSGEGEEQEGENQQQSQAQQAEESGEQDGGEEQQAAQQSSEDGEQTAEQEQADNEGEPQDEEQQADGEEQADGEDGSQDETQQAAGNQTMPEDEQAIEQWLRQVADNPAHILKRKFQHQQRQGKQGTPKGEDPW